MDKFPLLRLARESQAAGGSATCTLNAADEIAVSAFLEEQIPFTGIAEVVEETLSKIVSRTATSIGEVLEIDRESRATAQQIVNSRASNYVRPVNVV